MIDKNAQLIQELQQASRDMLYSSESEAPLKPFAWESDKQPLTPDKVRQLAGHLPNQPVEVVSLDEFFAPVATEQNWHDDKERETVKKFQSLVATLKVNLCDIKVYRIGERRIDVYIVGTATSGDWVGLATQVVQT